MSRKRGNLAKVAGLSCALCFAASADAAEKATTGTVETRIGPIELFMGLPATPEMVQKIYDEMDFQRATQAYIWALPIVAFNEWKLAHEKIFGAQQGDIVVYNNYKDKLGILTANFTTPYLVSFANLKEGPIVVDQPAGNYGGAIIDFWQRPIADMGQAGPDKGAGAKYLIVGPGQEVPKVDGYLVYQSPTNNIFLANRVLDPGEEKLKEALAKWSIYPYSERDHPPAHRSIAPEGKPWGQWQPRGMDYWNSFNDIFQQEPIEARDRMMTAMIAPPGLEKGKPFTPDARQTELLTQGALIGELMSIKLSYDKRFPGSYYRPDTKWAYVILLDPSQETPNFSQLDERADYFYEAVTMTEGMVSSSPGIGSAYLGAYKDKNNKWLDGGKRYTLHVPPNPPAKNFWSFTIYDVYDRVGIDNKTQLADISSRQEGLQKNVPGHGRHDPAVLGESQEQGPVRLTLATPYLAHASSRTKLEGELAALAAAAPRRERCQLSRLLRFAQDKGRLPGDIGEPQLEQFEAHLEHEAIHSNSVHVARTTRRAWNRCVDTVPGWPDRRLAAPARRDTPYWLRLEQLPATLQQEIEDYLHRLEHPDPFLGPGGKTLAPATIGQLRITFITLASALVASGMPVDKLSSIATLVQPDNLKKALQFLYARAGDRVYHLMVRVARRARTIGGHVGLPAQDLARIDSFVASVKREQSAEYGLTPKNRRLLAHFDDPAFVDRLLTFPQRLVEAAKTATNKRHAATRAPGRRRGRAAPDVRHAPGQSRSTARRGDHPQGRGRARRLLGGRPPGRAGQEQATAPICPAVRIRAVDRLVHDALARLLVRPRRALAVSCQGRWAYRPAAADDLDQEARAPVCRGRDHLPPIQAPIGRGVLQAHPLELGVVSQHLGHRKLDTTRTYYALEQTRVATERYHQVIDRKRAEALSRSRRKRRRTGSAR